MDWYASIWLRRYFDAKKMIAQAAPTRLSEFEHAMSAFRTDDAFQVKYVSGFLDAKALHYIRETIAAIAMELHELQKFGRLIVHDWPAFPAMQATMVDFVSELAGERVKPCYNFLSLYSWRGVCEPHLDTPSAKWTFDLCIDQFQFDHPAARRQRRTERGLARRLRKAVSPRNPAAGTGTGRCAAVLPLHPRRHR